MDELDPIERSLRQIEQARLRAQGLLREHADTATQERDYGAGHAAVGA